jgi:electron transfer flavoprotein beta subunit
MGTKERGLHIVACIKAVVTEVPVKGYFRSRGALELNPFDRPVLETALRLREEHQGTVTVLTMGPEASLSVLYEARAMGVDRMILVCDSALAGSDTLATAKALNAAVRRLMPFDLLLFGARSYDSDTGQVGAQTAVLLDLPLVTGVRSIERRNSMVRVERRADGFLERFEFSPPGILTIDPTSVRPRDPQLSRLESVFARGGEERWGLSDLDLSPDDVGWVGSATKVPSMKRVTRDRRSEFLSGSVDEQVEQLLARMRAAGVMD